MSTSHDTNERRQAIWPWILMPLVVLLVAYMLHGFGGFGSNLGRAVADPLAGEHDRRLHGPLEGSVLA